MIGRLENQSHQKYGKKKIVKVLCCFAKLCIELELLFFFFGNNYNRLRIVEEKKKDLHVWILISIIHRDVWNSSHPWLSDDAKPLTNASRLKDSLGENEPFTNFNWTFWPLLIAIYCVHRVCIWRSFNRCLQRNSLNPFLFAMPIQWSSLCWLSGCRAACTSKAKNCWNCIMNLIFVDSVKRINRTLNKIVSMNAFICAQP